MLFTDFLKLKNIFFLMNNLNTDIFILYLYGTLWKTLNWSDFGIFY